MQTLTRDKTSHGVEERRSLYVPEELTPLAFTKAYASLTPAQRQRYNQLHGYYYLEQTIFFEQHMGRPSLERLLEIAPTSDLRQAIIQFIDEENRHTGWFLDLLRECEPGWYHDRRCRVLHAGRVSRALLSLAARRPQSFPGLLWLQMITEERVQHFSTMFMRDAAAIDPRFVEVQRRHLADEGGHIHWDAELLEWIWPATALVVRRANARLLSWLLREFFYLPKRSGWNVVEHLIVAFPELAPRRSEFRAAMRGLSTNQTYLRTLYPSSVLSRTRRLASRWPELAFLEKFFTD